MPKFNQYQAQAINASIKENVLLAAGAGSGKTKTLSEKVYKIVSEGLVDPSEILVLTFTNKAAFEMKERIIKIFREKAKEGSEEAKILADKIVSSHIQTFDSFSLDLVTRYSSELGLASSISIMNESILESKQKEILDEILHDYYLDKPGHSRERILNSFSKFNTRDDSASKQMILSIDFELNKFLDRKKKDFMDNYDSYFLNDEFFAKAWSKRVAFYRQQIKDTVAKTYFLLSCLSNDNEPISLDSILRRFDDKSFLSYWPNGDEVSDKYVQAFLNIYQELLTCDDKEFFNLVIQRYQEAGAEQYLAGVNLMNHRYPKNPLGSFLYSNIRGILKDYLYPITLRYETDYEKEKDFCFSFKDDIHLIFDIIKEMNDKLRQYKEITGTYSFSDISTMAIELLTNPKHEKAADEIKNTFKCVLIDEYQDNNDIQEEFLNAITSKGASLFCVGDAKQSIYRFRNSNVQLFMDRKEAYQNKKADGQVIEMNWNYRSYIMLLEDINAIFSQYMSKNHGGLDFVGGETLGYDPAIQKPMADNGEYGMNLLTYSPIEGEHDDTTTSEARTILQDIQQKIENEYPVLNGDGTLRPCRYSDFAILIKKKRQFAPYQKLFDEYGIPLNNQLDDHLSEIDAIMLLQSLITLISVYLLPFEERMESKENLVHLFLSVARSYIYGKEEGYTDEHIYQIFEKKDIKAIYQDPIFLKIDDFCKRHQESLFSEIYLDLLEEFGVQRKLPTVGSLNDNLAKIESLFRIVKAQERAGEGIQDFVNLFKNLSKYQIEVTASTVNERENAVQLMSIHKSKGLEFPLVYLPVQDNYLSRESNMSKPLSTFSKEYGVLLPNFQLYQKVDRLLLQSYKEEEGSADENINEHVRLFYVALTRAKEACYIVGNKKKSGYKGKENLYEMLNSLYHYEKITDTYRKSGKKFSSVASLLDSYDEHVRLYKESYDKRIQKDQPRFASYSEEEFALAFTCYRQATLEKYEEAIREDFGAIAKAILVEYKEKILNLDLETRQAIYLKFKYTLSTTKEDLKTGAAYLGETELDFFYTDKTKSTSFLKLVVENKLTNNKEKLLSAVLFVLEGIKDPFYETYYDERYLRHRHLVLTKPTKVGNGKKVYPSFPVSDETLTFKTYTKPKRASKEASDEEVEEFKKKAIYGTHLHALMETVDLKKKDTSFIQDKRDKKILDNVLKLPVFADLENAKVYGEYEYYDAELRSEGIIDCLIVKEDCILIIDYKTKEIDDPAYENQLATYKRNIETLFPGKPVSTYLLSLINAELKEIN